MENYKPIADFLFEVGQLSQTPRSGFALLGTGPQNVAEHSYRAALVGYALARMMGDVDPARVALICLIHDLPETRIGDPNTLVKRYVHIDQEQILVDQLGKLPFGSELAELFGEYSTAASKEAVVAKDADQLELLLTLREQEARGQIKASDWLERTMQRLQTEAARHLAQAIVGGDPSHWWEEPLGEEIAVDTDDSNASLDDES